MLYFKKIRWQNFMSTGNTWTEIDLCKSKSTLVVGENGSGKSTLLDAISFVLYGKPYRDINKPQLLNSITKKNLIVEIEFKSGKNEYRIVRGMRPNVFEIFKNEKLLDQNANIREYQEELEKNVLKLNHKSFCQIIVIGSANFTPFMQLRPYERRQVIEDMLDIQVFSYMHNLLKERIARNKEDLKDTRYEIDMLKQNIELTKKHMRQIDSIKRENITKKKQQLRVLLEKYEKKKARASELNKEIDKLMSMISDNDSVKKDFEDLKETKYKIKHKIDHLEKEIHFFNNNDECPTCRQIIDDDFKESHLCKKDSHRESLNESLDDIESKMENITKRLHEISNTQEKISKKNIALSDINTDLMITRKSIESLGKEISEANEIVDNSSQESLNETKQKLKVSNNKLSKLLEVKETYEYAYSLLKDGGIKTQIIKQYIPIINKLVNKYLAAMDFFVQFELDNNFNEKIRSRFRDEFTYNSFSEGEKMRIDLALLFTWRSVAKLRNSASSNLLILDEVFDSSLDVSGTEEFLKIITQLNNDTNVFVISHKGDQLFDKFHSVIRFEKVKNFSQIAE